MARYLLLALALTLVSWRPVEGGERRLEMFVGGGVAFTGPNFYVTLDEEGRLAVKTTGMPIVPPGKLTEKSRSFRISRSEAEALWKLAEQAEDFAKGCNVVADGTSARLSLTDGQTSSIRKCSNASEWPIGRKSRGFVDRLNKNLPESWRVH